LALKFQFYFELLKETHFVMNTKINFVSFWKDQHEGLILTQIFFVGEQLIH